MDVNNLGVFTSLLDAIVVHGKGCILIIAHGPSMFPIVKGYGKGNSLHLKPTTKCDHP